MSESTSDSDVQIVDGGGAKTRPKLRTTARRQAPWYAEAPTDESEQDDASVEAVAPPAAAASSSSSSSARPKRKRDEEPDEDFEVEEEEEDDDEDEEEEEDDGRRRSGRTRNKVTSYVSSDDFDFDDFEDDEADKPKRKRLSTSKKPRNSGKSASSGKKRQRSRKESDDDSDSSGGEILLDDESASDAARDIVNIDDDDDDDDDDVSSSKRRAQSKKQQQQQPQPMDDDDEKSFIIDKLLAREVHTRNEWTKICANKKSRFLHNFSIFLPDDEEEATEGDSASAASTATPEQAATETDVIDVDDSVEKFLVKWKNLSYLHTSWETEKDLLDVDKNAKGKLQRFREKEAYGFFADNTNGDEYYNPEFRIVDRILDIQDRPDDDFAPADDEEDDPDKRKLQYFLVKWKALPYDQTTWEREDDVNDDAAVQEYNKRLVRAAARFRKAVSEKKQSSRHRRFKVQHFHAYTARSPPPKKASQSFELRDYQLTGVNWMLFNWYQNRNSMLADEMGLGKTVQTVMYLNHLAEVEQTPNPFLILAPLSTLSHWQREFENWTNLNAIVYHGSAPARSVLQNYEFFLSVDELARADAIKGRKPVWGSKAPPRPKRDCFRFDVLITSYEMCSGNDYGKLARIPWQVMVVDEAHRLKNRTSKLSSMLHKNFKFEKILLLTGTPLQNNVEELWTLLNFLDGDRFKSKEAFLEQFGDLKDSSQVEQLHAELKPFLLRRMKEDVEKSLAPKEETIIEVELTVLQKQYYRAIYEKNTEFLSRGRKKGHAPSLMNIMMELRKCCNHAFLIKGAEEREISRLRQQFKQQQKQKTDGKDAKSLVDQEAFEREARELLVTSSGKLVLLDKLLPRLKENGHRVLIFSQFKIMLDIIQDYLKLRSYRCERIDGNITGNDRQSAIDRFCDPESAAFIMLLSTRAGGVGINLTAADTVIIYDSDWNPQNDLQAQARCHRIGQKKSVKIYRLLTPKTYELHMFHQASLKLGLDQAVLGGIRNNNASSLTSTKGKANPNARLSKEEIENLLKHGAYEMFKEEKDGEAEAASKRFSEESIDQILSRSTTIVHDPKKAADSGKKSFMSSFSKATFVSSSNPDEVVDIDDPDFWTKVVGLKAVEELERERAAAEASPLKRRRARRVKSYADEQLQFDDGTSDDNSTILGKSRKKSSKSQKSLQNAMANVEVISDDDDYSDDDDASDDEDDDDELLDDDFMILDNKKRRRGTGANATSKKRKADLPPMYLYKENVLELMFEYGYGRWEELQRNNPGLRRYPMSELQQFAYVFIASCVRLACAPTMASVAGVELTMYHIYNARILPPSASAALDEATSAAVGTSSAVAPSTSPFLEKLGRCLDDYAKRFKFISQMIKDAGVSRLSDIVILPELRRDLPVPAKGDRQLVQKLHQIDRMFALSNFVRSKLITPSVPASVLGSLLNDFQAVGDNTTVRELIRAGKLPPLRLTPATPAPAPTTSVVVPAPVSTVAAATSDDTGNGATTDAVASEQATSTVVAPSSAVTTSSPVTTSTSTTPTKDEASTTAAAESAAPKPDGAVPSNGEDSMPADVESKAEADTEEPVASASTPASSTPVSTVADKETQEEDATGPDDNPATPVTATTDAGTTSQPEVTAADTASKPVAAAAPVPQLTPRQQEQRQAALQTLRRLMALDLGNASSVAPWWLSVIDDVMLVLYIYRDGWMRTRIVPTQMARDSSLFGSRAAAYSSTEWPTIAALNRRAKSLISLWMMTSPKVATTSKPAAHGSSSAPATANSEHTSSASSWTNFSSSTATHTRTPALPSLMQTAPHRQLQYQQQQIYHHQQQQQQSVRPKLLGSKHNQFAKLVFSYGIPDMRACRTTQERLEKWRYFLQDALLDVASTPLERLLAEARDLERVCRERVHMSEESSTNSFISPTKAQPTGNDAVALATVDLKRSGDRTAADSIFGGHRGYWMLSTTQCRRLLHRVDLFRLLRTQILVLPPGQLVEVIGRVIKALQAKQAGPTYPIWWSSPRHDILLLQGVECYGLDDHLAQVWKLPLFAQVTAASAHTPFPNSTWVENYVSTLASASRKLLEKARLYREEAKRRERMQASRAPVTVDMTGEDEDGDANDADEDEAKAAARLREQEALQRVRDIGDMRAEDPIFTLSVRLRQLLESNEAAKAALRKTQEEKASNRSSPSGSVTAIAPASTSRVGDKATTKRLEIASSLEGEARERLLMRSEDPYESELVRQQWMKQIRQDELAAVHARAAVSPDASTAPKPPADGKDSKSMTVKEESAASTAAPALSGAGRGREASTSPATSARSPSLRRRPPPPTERKRALRSFELIVIDDSDDSDDD